jgi:lauroyl/myristoyl acyltransferase
MGHMPEPLAQGVARAVARGLALRGGAALAMNERHLRRVLASECAEGVEPDPVLVRRWSRRTFDSYAQYWADGARLPYESEAGVRDRFRFEEGEDRIRAAFALGRGVVMALPHVGSWEWGGAWLALNGYPMTAVAEPLEPPELYDYFVEQREQLGLTIVKLGPGTGSVLLKTLRSGGLVGLLCDRDIVGNGVGVEFFGEKTTFPSGPATLALRTGAMLLPTVVYSGPGKDHSAVIRPPLDTERTTTLRADVARVTQALAYELEGLVRRAPDQWHLFQPNWPSDELVSTSRA